MVLGFDMLTLKVENHEEHEDQRMDTKTFALCRNRLSHYRSTTQLGC